MRVSVNLDPSVHHVPWPVHGNDQTSGSVAVCWHIPYGPCHDYQHDRLRVRARMGPVGSDISLDIVVDRRGYFSGFVHVVAIYHHAHPRKRAVEDDGGMAPAYRGHHRRSGFGRYCC